MLIIPTFRTIARLTKMLLLLFLIGLEFVISSSKIDLEYINQASLQLTHSQQIVNAIYTLAYRPEAEHRRAMQVLQQTVALFETEQTILLNNQTTEVQLILAQARSDYLSLDTVAHIILAHPQARIDHNEIDIVAAYERPYLLTLNELALLLPQLTQNQSSGFFFIQMVTEGVFLMMFLAVIATYIQEKRWRVRENAWRWTLFWVTRTMVFLLLLLLIGVEIIALSSIKDEIFFNQMAVQRTRCEVLVKSALILAYRPAEEKAQAVNGLQVSLPLFQQGQALLLSNESPTVRSLAQQAQSEVQIMVTAAQNLMAHPDSPDPVAVTTLISHQESCLSKMASVIVAIEHQKEQFDFPTEIVLEGFLFIVIGSFVVFSPHPSMLKTHQRA